MEITICDYCLDEDSKVTETKIKTTVNNKISLGACMKHKKQMFKSASSDRNSKEFQEMSAMISRNSMKKGNVLINLKKKK